MTKKILFLFFALLAISNTFGCNVMNHCDIMICNERDLEESYKNKFSEFISQNNRQYTDDEYDTRFEIFKKKSVFSILLMLL